MRSARMLMSVKTPGTTRKPTSLAEDAYDKLRREIIECQLVPGVRLTEAEIAERLELGKTPAREALRRLTLEGLVQVAPRHGYFVSPITLRDVQELFGLRMIVEPASVELAVDRLEATDLAQLEQLGRVGYTPGDRASIREFQRANTMFHLLFAHASGNRRLEQLLERLLIESERLINHGVQLSPQSEDTLREHQQLLEAARAGDTTRAREIALSHLRATEQMVLESVLSATSLRDAPIGPRPPMMVSVPR